MRSLRVILILVVLAWWGAAPAMASSCYDCHDRNKFKGNAVHGPVAKGDCGKCHNPHVAKYKGLLQEEGAELCYDCHAKERREYAKGMVHQPVLRGQCVACHAPHASAQRNLLQKPLAKLCFSCHEGMQQNHKVMHAPYAKGECTACHEPHNGDDAQLLKKNGDALCAGCHAKPETFAGHKGFPGKMGACLTCHNPHGSSRAGLIREKLHAPYQQGCTACHGKNLADSALCFSCHEAVKKQMFSPHSHLVVTGGNSCIACHSPHAADTGKMLKAKESLMCGSCHADTMQRRNKSLHKHPMVSQCSDCHEAHGSSRLVLMKGDGNAVCSRCHETQGKFSHPVGPKVIDRRTGQSVNCLTCHDPMGTDFRYHLKQSGKKDLCVQCHRSY
ncbi:MAG: cytochrome c3 family protein [Thermodesulfobacteriota bacterium]